MNVLFIARASLHSNRGGDTIQLHKTAAGLEELGVRVTIRLADEDISYANYDLIHFFNLLRPADILRHARNAEKPYVISPLFVDYSEADRRTRKGMLSLLLRIFSPDQVEYGKVFARRLRNGERVSSPDYWWRGQRGSIRRVLRDAAMLLPNSVSEFHRLQHEFPFTCPYKVVPNAIDPHIFSLSAPGNSNVLGAAPDTCREKDLVLSAARIDGIKNQLNLIRAINGSDLRLILIGSPAVNQQAYYEECRREAGPTITFVEAVSQENLASYYRRAKVHALPSWFETTGLSSLEAAAMGCSIVITAKGDTKEYFGDDAVYCDPASPDSIREALYRALRQGPSARLREKVLSHYNWRQTAAATLEAYRSVLGIAQISTDQTGTDQIGNDHARID
jgi:glycosyltransferase involved in cell wall biosynthesis